MKPGNAMSSLLLRGLGLISHVVPNAGAAVIFRFMTAPRRRHRLRGVADSHWRTPSGLVVHSWGETGPLVLCLHGWESSGLQFCGLAAHLKSRGFRVWAVDATAHGQSPGRRATPLDLFYGLCEVHALAEEPVSVVGHSSGATMVMLAMRERIAFSHIVLMSGPTCFAEMFAYFNKFIGLPSRSYEALVRRIEKRIGRKLDPLNMLMNPPEGSALIVHDSEDAEVPLEASVSLARVWTQAQLWVTHGLGHRRILRSEKVWERIGDYLAEGSSAQTAHLDPMECKPSRQGWDKSIPCPSPLY